VNAANTTWAKNVIPSIALAMLLCSGSCSLSLDEAVVSLWDRPAGILVFDGPEVRKLIETETRRQEAASSNGSEGEGPDLAKRSTFVGKLESFPSTLLTSGTDLRVLERTICRCEPYPHVTPVILLAEVRSGPKKGSIGWICQGSVQFKHPAF
jgi:hypothetical protein